MEVEIICKENIKPSSPTPLHLKQFKVSIIDQLTTSAYIPFLLFYPNNNHQKTDQNVILARNNLLRKSLSETLVSFYPLAGVINHDDSLNIDCNDNGVHYVETRIKNQELPDFLKRLEAKSMRRLFPYDPDLVQFSGKTYVVAIQVNIFACGGIAFGVFFTHKIIDAYSIATFMNSWGKIARGFSNETISPSFDASFIFRQNPTLSKDEYIVVRPPSLKPLKCVPILFLFQSSALSELKTKASIKMNASRVVSVVGLIWKSLISASKKRYGFQKPSVLTISVNLRSRISPPLPDFAMGNVIWSIPACFGPEKDPELSSIVTCLQDAINKIDAQFIEGLKGSDGGSMTMADRLRKLQEEAYSDEDAEYYCASSWNNLGFDDIDFGFGKPSRIVHGCPDSNNPGVSNMILLNDFGSGNNGIELFVSVSEDDMMIIEQDHELLSFASIISKFSNC